LGDTIPNQALLVDSLILQEAKSSSEIENILTTNDALFKAFTAKTSRIDPATKEVLSYREALWKSFHELKQKPVLSTNLFVSIVQTIKGNQVGIRRTPGIAIVNAKTREVIYTPPGDEAFIRDKLRNLEKFIHENDSIDPLIKLGVIHYQFEAIHPFYDGNGRTGRIINILYLVLNGLLNLPVLYLSKFIIEHKNDYYRLIREVTEKGLWEPWILYMLEAIENTADFTRERILAIRGLMSETMERARQDLPARVYSKELIELLFRQPYTKGQFLVDADIAKRQTAAEYLRELEKIGILKSDKIGKDVLYMNVGLYDLLSR
ncbi:Fic family protein, partial [bacterium]|nr:Fic family protein [bacterium]